MADLIFPNIVGSVNAGYDRGQQQQFNHLAGQYISSNGQDNGAFAQAASINPNAALGVQQDVTATQNAHLAKIAGAANYVLNAVKSGNPAQVQGAYQAVKPFLAELGASQGKVPPDEFSDDMLPMLYQIVGQAGGTPYEGPKVLAPGSELVGVGGNVLHSTPFGDKILNNVPVGPNGEKGAIAVNPGAHGQGNIIGLGGAPTAGVASPAFYDNVNDLAGKYGATITSGVRSPEHNAEVGGVPNSQHLTGTAADVVIPPDQKDQFIADAKARGLQPIDEGDHVHLQNPNGGAGVTGMRLAIGTPVPKTNTWQQRIDAAKALGATQQEQLGMVLGASANNNAAASALSPDALTNATFDYLINKTLPPIGRGGQGQAQRTAIMNNAADVAKALDMTPADFATRGGQQKAYQASLTAYQKRSDAMQGQEQSFLRNLDYAQGISDQVDRTGSPAVNKWLLTGEEQAGDADVARLKAALTPVAADYARIMSGSTGAGGTPVSTQQEALELLRAQLSKNQFAAVADVLRNDVHNQRLGVADQMAVIQNRMRSLGNGSQGGVTSAQTPAAAPATSAANGQPDHSSLWGG